MSGRHTPRHALYTRVPQRTSRFLPSPSPPFRVLLNPSRRVVLNPPIPSTQRTPPLRDVANRIRHARIVQRLVDIRVRTNDVKLALCHLLDAVLGHLGRQPGATRLLRQGLLVRHGAHVAAEARVRPARHEQVRGDGRAEETRALGAEVVRQLLGQGLDGGLRRVVRRVARWVRDALLRARQQHGARAAAGLAALGHHHGQKRRQAVHHAEQVHAQRLLEVRRVGPRARRAHGGPGVEHQEVDGLEFARQVALDGRPGAQVRHIDLVRQREEFVVDLLQRGRRGREGVLVDVEQR